jgi:hypothetical protein
MPFGWHQTVQTLERLIRLAVVMLPPCPSLPLAAAAMHMFRFFEVFLGLLRVVRLLQARRHEAQAYVHTRRVFTKSKLKPRTTRHESSILIFDEARIRTFY